MLVQLDKEGKEDAEVYEAMGCLCETNEKEKTKAIADAKDRIPQLAATSEKSAATSSEMANSIEEVKSELAANKEALESATALRNKQLAEYTAEEGEMLKSISSLGSAVGALAKHNSAASFLQIADETQRKS